MQEQKELLLRLPITYRQFVNDFLLLLSMVSNLYLLKKEIEYTLEFDYFVVKSTKYNENNALIKLCN